MGLFQFTSFSISISKKDSILIKAISMIFEVI